MIFSLQPSELLSYTAKQLQVFFPDDNVSVSSRLKSVLHLVEDRLVFCFKHIKKPYFYDGKDFLFNHLNGDHYAMYLYILSNSVWQIEGEEELASKIFLLNKFLHGIDIYYKISLPNIFLFVHPVGTVLGKAEYKDYFIVYQNCTVGSTEAGIYPMFAEGVVLCSKSSVIGDCKVGSNTIFGANSFIINRNIVGNSVVVGSYPNYRERSHQTDIVHRFFS